ncbi:hypothetical protein [Sinorhizobium sp. BG8]|uniref:hypothetical protein n=1 Tax=Sinorhizobium sp. BG8 TaxID=2613773 RepID=UPI00193CCDD9|nr:hypothetical protein [Sinorhizobium sp. BG8]QRM55305.1 hypothetical protein F3Y30_12745 [Sinorhizobium sp. BG8]
METAWNVKDWVQIILVVTIPLTLILMSAERVYLGKDFKGIGLQVLRLTSLGVALPLIAVLAIQGTLGGETIGTLFGAVIGFLFGQGAQQAQPASVVPRGEGDGKPTQL